MNNGQNFFPQQPGQTQFAQAPTHVSQGIPSQQGTVHAYMGQPQPGMPQQHPQGVVQQPNMPPNPQQGVYPQQSQNIPPQQPAQQPAQQQMSVADMLKYLDTRVGTLEDVVKKIYEQHLPSIVEKMNQLINVQNAAATQYKEDTERTVNRLDGLVDRMGQMEHTIAGEYPRDDTPVLAHENILSELEARIAVLETKSGKSHISEGEQSEKRTRRKTTYEEYIRVKQLADSGKKTAEIEKELDIPYSTVAKYIKLTPEKVEKLRTETAIQQQFVNQEEVSSLQETIVGDTPQVTQGPAIDPSNMVQNTPPIQNNPAPSITSDQGNSVQEIQPFAFPGA